MGSRALGLVATCALVLVGLLAVPSAGAATRIYLPLGARAVTFGATPAATTTPATTGTPEATRTPLPTTATDVIAEAEAAGTISPYQATLYRLQAMVADPALPAAYAGSASSRPPGHLTSDAMARIDSLSQGEQSALRPYLVRPNSGASYYAGATARGRGAQTIDRPRRMARYDSAANGRVWVWADSSSVLSTVTAERVAAILGLGSDDLVLKPLESMMGVAWAGDKRSGLNDLTQDNWFLNNFEDPNFDERLDIYVVPLGILGETVSGSSTPNASFVLISDSIEGDTLEYTVRHELFHVIQNRFKMTGSSESNKWWLESTADWSVTQMRPTNTYAYVDHAPHYLDRTTRRVDLWSGSSRDQLHAYGSFGWPITIDARAGGGSGSAIRDVFSRMGSLSPMQAIKTTLAGSGKDTAEVWRDFAVASLNTEYVRRGKSGDTLFGAWRPQFTQQLPTANLHKRTFATGGKSFVENKDLKVELDRFGVQYWAITFDDDTRQALFRLQDWTKETGSGVVALKRKKGEQWSSLNLDDIKEDWSKPLEGETENWRYLCRDKKDDNVEELILVFTNGDADASSDKTYSATLTTDLSNVACRWKGTVTLQESSETLIKWLFDINSTTDSTTQVTDLVLETQGNPMDARPVAFMEESDYVLNQYPHAMPVMPTRWRVQHDASLDVVAGGDQCRETVTGRLNGPIPPTPPSDQDMFALPFTSDKPTFSLVIWGEDRNRWSIAVGGKFDAQKTGCEESSTEKVELYLLNIGSGPSVLDDVRTVSATGDRISATRERVHDTPKTCVTLQVFDVEICTGGKVTSRWTIDLERFPEQ